MKSQEELWTHLCVTIEVIMNILIKNSDKNIFIFHIIIFMVLEFENTSYYNIFILTCFY